MRPALLALLALLPGALLGATACPVPAFGVGARTVPLPGEISVEKDLTLRLDAGRPLHRFFVPVTVEPATSSFRLEAVVLRSARLLRLELVDGDTNTSDDPAAWPLVERGAVATAFAPDLDTGRFQLSLGLDPFDDGEPLDVDVVLRLTASDDSDFDGVRDGVVVEIGSLEIRE